MKTLSIRCIECEDTITFDVPEEGLVAFNHGALAQVAFPDVPAEHREMLISKICPKCWDRIFKDDDE